MEPQRYTIGDIATDKCSPTVLLMRVFRIHSLRGDREFLCFGSEDVAQYGAREGVVVVVAS